MQKEIKNWLAFLLRHKVRLVAWLLCILLFEVLALKINGDIVDRIFAPIIGVMMSYAMIFRDFESKRLK